MAKPAKFKSIEFGKYPKIVLITEKGEWKVDCSKDVIDAAETLKEGDAIMVDIKKNDAGFWRCNNIVKGEAVPQAGKWQPQPYDPRQFVSNVVGNGIQAGLIKTPGELIAWARVAYETMTNVENLPKPNAAKETKAVDDEFFNDDLNF